MTTSCHASDGRVKSLSAKVPRHSHCQWNGLRRFVQNDVMAERSLDQLHVSPLLFPAVLQREDTSSDVRRLSVPADRELIERALNAVIERIFSGL